MAAPNSTPDVTVEVGPLSDTEVTVKARTMYGIALLGVVYGRGTLTVTIPKTALPALSSRAKKEGITMLEIALQGDRKAE